MTHTALTPVASFGAGVPAASLTSVNRRWEWDRRRFDRENPGYR